MRYKRTKIQLALLSTTWLIVGMVGWDALLAQDAGADSVKLVSSGVVRDWSDWVVCTKFSADGKLVAGGSYDVVKLIKVDTLEVQSTIETGSGFARSLCFSPDGLTLAVGGYQTIQFVDVKSAKVTKALKGHRGQVTGLRFTTDSKQLVSGADDQTLRVWDVATGKSLRKQEFSLPVQSIDLTADAKRLAVATGDPDRPTVKGQVLLLDLAGRPVHPLTGHKKAASDVCFVGGGKRLLSASHDQTVNVHDVETGKTHGFFSGHVRPVNALVTQAGYAVSVSGGSAKGKNEIRVWKIEDGEELLKMEPHEFKVTDVAISPDGALIATCSEDKTLALWKTPALLRAQQDLPATAKAKSKPLRIGIIGLDTSHSTAFTKMLNGESGEARFKDCRIVAAYPKGSADIQSSASRIPGYTAEVRKHGVKIVDSIEELLPLVDFVLLETNDGRPHLEQLIPCLKAKKPVFVDKPIAASLTDAIAIFEAAKHFGVPVFSSSSLRFSDSASRIRNGQFGKVLGADAYSPCKFEATHPDLFWYGIHGVETLFTVMGPGCESVMRTTNESHEVVVGKWKDAGVGTFRGIRQGKSGYGGTVYTQKGIHPIGKYDGYKPLLVEIIKFFQSGTVPVDERETIEIYAFMEAADESKRQAGKSVTLRSVIEPARKAAAEKLKAMGIE